MGSGDSKVQKLLGGRVRLCALPDFLGIGAMRAGTSWFAAHLARHPEIQIPRKELHFFDHRFDRRVLPFISGPVEARMRYRARFLGAGLGGRITGEFTPSYAVLESDRIATVFEWMPGAKLLFIMCDPVERAWSQAKHDYAGFLGRDPATAPEAELRAFFARPGVWKRGDYATCLENWLRHFNRRQLFITFLEHVKVEPDRVLTEAFSFLGVSVDVALDGQVAFPVHAGPDTAMPTWVREHLEEKMRPLDTRLEALVDTPLPWRDANMM